MLRSLNLSEAPYVHSHPITHHVHEPNEIRSMTVLVRMIPRTSLKMLPLMLANESESLQRPIHVSQH